MTSPTSDRRQGLVGNTPIKAPVDCATTGNITLSGEQVIDGVQTNQSRVLVWQQTNATQNGLYDSSTAAWTRCLDADGNYDLTTGTLVSILGGTSLGGNFFQVATPKPITIGTSILSWVKALFSSSSILSFLAKGLGAIVRSVQDKLRERISVVDYGADPTGVVDSTAACNAAHVTAGIGGTVFYPRGAYRINGTITMLPGQVVRGDGWSSTVNSFAVASGSELRQYSVANIPLLQIVGTDDNHQQERWGVYDIALTCSTPSATFGTGFYADYARQGHMRNVYVASFSTSLDFEPQCWQMLLEGVRCMDFAIGMINNSSSEDNCFITCQWAGYRTGSIAVSLVNQSANNLFLNCYMQACQSGCVMQQGDNGTLPFPMFSTWISPLIEDITQAAFVMISSKENVSSSLHPGLTLINPRVLNTGLSGYGATNTPSTSASGTGATATIGFAVQAAAPLVGSVVTISGMTPAGYNGSRVVTASTTSSVSFASATTGAQTVAGTVIFGTTTYNTAPNNGQSIVYAAHCSQVKVEMPYEGGFSYGITAGIAAYGFFPAGTLPGPITWGNDNAYTYGTSRFNGKTGSITLIPGEFQQGRVGTSGVSIALAGSFGNPTWDVVTDNAWGWWDVTNSRFNPQRSQATRFSAAIYIAATVSGARYMLQVNKNGTSGVAILADITANGTGPLQLAGDWIDVPNGTTDFYKVQLFCNSGASATILPQYCSFTSELVGN